MKAILLLVTVTLFLCVRAIAVPAIGLIGYFGYTILNPGWNWRWSLEGLEFTKYIAIATLAGFILSGFQGNRLTGATRWACIFLTAYAALAGISTIYSVAPAASVWYMDTFWKIWLMAVVACFLLDSPHRVFAMMWVVVLAQGYNAYQVNLDYFINGMSSAAQYGWNWLDNNTYALSTLPTMALSAGLAIYSAKLWQKGLAGAIFVLQMHQLMLLQSRGAFVAALVLMILFLIHMPKNLVNVAAALGILGIGIALAGPSVVEKFQTVFVSAEERDDSATSRFEVWKAGMEITADYPLLGVGAFAGEHLVPRYSIYSGAKKKALHNLFFEISTGSGIPSLVFYLLFFGLIWGACFRLRVRQAVVLPVWAKCSTFAVLTGLPPYFLASCFSSGALIESSYVLAVIGAGTLAVLQRQSDEAWLLLTEIPQSHEQRFEEPVVTVG